MRSSARYLDGGFARRPFEVGGAWAQAPLTKVTLVSSTVNPPSISNIYYLAAIDGGCIHQARARRAASAVVRQSEFARGHRFRPRRVRQHRGDDARQCRGRRRQGQDGRDRQFRFSRHDAEHARRSSRSRISKASAWARLPSARWSTRSRRSYLKKQGVDLSKIEWVATRQTPEHDPGDVGRPDCRGMDRDVVRR